MAAKTEIRNVNIVINGKEVTNNVKAIGKEYKKAKNELAGLTIGSDKYNKKVLEVKKLKGVLDEHRKSLGFVQSSWQKLGSSLKTLLPVFGLGTLVAGTKRLVEFTVALKQNRAEVKKLSELTGPALDTATARVTAIANVYKKDFGEVLQATNALSKKMGITFNEAFDLIEKGFQAGADANGEFLEQVREYPTFFKEAEFSAEQFITQITKQTKSGIFSDKGIDAIKEATLSLREMTKPTSDALKALGIDSEDLSKKIGSGQIKMSDAISLVAKKMSELPAQSQAVGQGLADIFKGAGEDAGVAFIATLADVNDELDDMIDNNNDLVKAQQNNLIATTELNAAYLKMLGEGSALSNFWAQQKRIIGEELNDIATIVSNNELTLLQKIVALNKQNRKIVATSIQKKEAVEEEAQAYDLLNKQLVLQAQNLGIIIDLTELENAEIVDLINKKQAQIEAERQLAKAEKDRQDKAEKARKKFLAAEKKLQAKIQEIREQLQLNALSDQAKELQAVEFKYAKLEAEAKGNAGALKQIAELRNQEIADINKKFTDETLVKRAEVEAKIQEMLLSGKDKEIAVVAKKYQELIELAEKFGFDTADLFTKMQEEIAKITEETEEDNPGGWLQNVLGLNDEQWEKLEEKFQTLGKFVSEAANAYSAFSNLRSAQDDADLQKFEQNQDIKKARLEKQLKFGVISQESFNDQVQKLDEQTEKERAKIAGERAEREKTAAIFDTTINGLAAVIRFLVDPGGIAGIALAALAGVTAGIQIAAIQAEPVPAFEDGGRIKKEGLIFAGEGNKEEGILSNAVLTDPELGPVANFLLDRQAGIPASFPTTATATPDFGDVSRAVGFNNFQRSGGQFTQDVTNNNVTNTTAPTDNTSQQILEEFQKMNEFLSDPVNRQAYINYDKEIESQDEMRYLNDLNDF